MTVSVSYTLSIPPLSSETATEVGGEIVAIPDHCADGLAVLIQEYRDSPVLQALICAFLVAVQDAEDDANALLTEVLSISDAVGSQLDLIGELVGEPRDGRADADYRRTLRVRILVNRSNGRAEDLIAVADRWAELGEGESVEVAELYPHALRITLRADPGDPVGLLGVLREAKAAGVSLALVYLPAGADTFRCSTAHGTVTTSGRGFASAHAIAYDAGGLAGVLS